MTDIYPRRNVMIPEEIKKLIGTGGAVYVSFTVEAGGADGGFPSGTVGVLNDLQFDVDGGRIAGKAPVGKERQDAAILFFRCVIADVECRGGAVYCAAHVAGLG